MSQINSAKRLGEGGAASSQNNSTPIMGLGNPDSGLAVKVSLKLIYHYENGEIRQISEMWPLIEQIISNQPSITSFESDFTEYGNFHNEIFAYPGGLVIVSKWTPAIGYSWEELRVYVLKIPGE